MTDSSGWPTEAELRRAVEQLARGLGRPITEDEFDSVVEYLNRLSVHAALLAAWKRGEIAIFGHDGTDWLWIGTEGLPELLWVSDDREH
jgi:hypothetical protein